MTAEVIAHLGQPAERTFVNKPPEKENLQIIPLTIPDEATLFLNGVEQKIVYAAVQGFGGKEGDFGYVAPHQEPTGVTEVYFIYSGAVEVGCGSKNYPQSPDVTTLVGKCREEDLPRSSFKFISGESGLWCEMKTDSGGVASKVEAYVIPPGRTHLSK